MGYTPTQGYLGGGSPFMHVGERGGGGSTARKKDRHPPPRIGRYTPTWCDLGGIPIWQVERGATLIPWGVTRFSEMGWMRTHMYEHNIPDWR